MKIHVQCHSGYKVHERPIKFQIGERVLFVESIEDQWYGPNALYFRVRADDQNTYVLAKPRSRAAIDTRVSAMRKGFHLICWIIKATSRC